MDRQKQARSNEQSSSAASPASSGSNLPKFEVSQVSEEPSPTSQQGSSAVNNNSKGRPAGANGGGDDGGIMVVKNMNTTDGEADVASPFIVSLPSEEGRSEGCDYFICLSLVLFFIACLKFIFVFSFLCLLIPNLLTLTASLAFFREIC